MRACLRFWKSLRRIRESFGSFCRAGFGEIRNGVLATHFPCTTLLPPTNSIFLFCTGLRVTRRDRLAIELLFFKTIDACIAVKIKAPLDSVYKPKPNVAPGILPPLAWLQLREGGLGRESKPKEEQEYSSCSV